MTQLEPSLELSTSGSRKARTPLRQGIAQVLGELNVVEEIDVVRVAWEERVMDGCRLNKWEACSWAAARQLE